jgi:hypothetical protein
MRGTIEKKDLKILGLSQNGAAFDVSLPYYYKLVTLPTDFLDPLVSIYF